MNASFDGARRNLSRAYNNLAQLVNEEPTLCKEDVITEMNDLQSAIGALLCMYDPNCDVDANDMSNSINLICVE